ncbi:MAG TPA: LysR family transcriptional regulator [Bordetella sp.]
MLNRLEILRIFSAAAGSPTFREAATRLGVSPQVVTRAIRELEAALGETLFHRSTRRVQITAFGQTFAAKVQSTLISVDELFDSSISTSDEVSGTVRITAPAGFGRRYVLPILSALMIRHPGLRLDVRLSDTPSAVVDEQIDIGVRAGAIEDNRFVARVIGPLPMWVVGSPELIARVGEPRNLQDLQSTPTTTLIDRATGRPWPWIFRGEAKFQPRNPVFVTDDPETEIEVARAGVGFSQCAEYLARPYVEAGRLARILPRFEPAPWKLHVYRPQRGPVPKRIRIVFDELAAQLAHATSRD